MIKSVSFEESTYADVPAKFEAGTPNIADAVGLGTAIDYLARIGLDAASRYEEELTAYGMQALACIPGLRQIGTVPHKLSVLSFVLAGIPTEDVGQFLDREGIAVRAGHHCAQPTMRRYGVTSAVRPALAFYNTREEIDALTVAVRKAQRELL
jgi:cysteine desulfurase/selenocysteine lyase